MKSIFKGQLSRLLLPLLFPFLFIQWANATAISSKQSGPWTSASTWEGGVVPTNFQDVIIKTGHTVTRNNAFICQAYLYVYGTIVYTGNVSRKFNPGNDIEIQGLLRVEGGTLFADGIVYGNGIFRQTGGSTTFGRAYVVENTDIQAGAVLFMNTNNGNLFLDNLSLKNATLEVDGTENLEIKVSMNWNNGGKVLNGTTLRIDDGATLTFDGGNSKHYSDGTILNYGSIYCTSGALDRISSGGNIYNYGYWEFNTQANAGFDLAFQYIVNYGGEILKKGPGVADFLTSSHYFDEGAATFHIQQGSASFTTNSTGHELNGLWQLDANTYLLVFGNSPGQSAPFNPTKFINNGTVYGRVKFVGTGANIVAGQGKFEYLEIAKTSDDVTLEGSPEVISGFTLTSGKIVLNQYDLHLGSAAISYTSDYSSYIQTNSTGSCEIYCPVNSLELFPIGNADFAPFALKLDPASTADFIKIRVTDSFYGEYNGFSPGCNAEIPVGVVGHTWFAAERVAGGSTIGAAAYWLADAERSGFDRSNCTVAQYVAGNWQPGPFTPAQDASPLFVGYNSSVTGLGIFGVFDAGHETDVNFITPAPAGNSPVCEWSDLQLHANTSQNADIQWSGPNGYTSYEQDPAVPGIQLSQGGVYTVTASQYGCPAKQATINVIVNALPNATIVGPSQIQAGESTTLTAYGGVAYAWNSGATTQSIDISPTQTTDYLVSVTSNAGCTDVALQTVQVISATATSEANTKIQPLKLTPNPVIDETLLTFESMESGQGQLFITDARGAKLYQQNTSIVRGQNQITIPLGNLPTGAYQVTLIRENEVKTIRAVKIKGD